jgi:beta-xylosidase
MSFNPELPEHEAGLTIFMARDYHYDLFLSQRRGEKVLIARRRIDDIDLEEKVIPIADEEVTIKVAGDPWQYTFSYYDGEDFKELVTMKNWFITIHTGILYRFTGMFLGLYAVGEGQEASFDYFKYQPVPTIWSDSRLLSFGRRLNS